MVYRGTIKSGGVVLPADVTLPEGTEVLVALPDQGTGPAAGPAVREWLAEVGRWSETLPTDWPHPAATPEPCGDHPSGHAGPAEVAPSYPVADFLSPTEYAWDADVYAAEQAVRAYLDNSYADH
jgi:hypothetical protein